MNEPGAVVLARHWDEPASELAFVTRSLAGAASRWGPVSVLVPGRPDGSVADGAFDVVAVGPDDAPAWPAGLSPDRTVIVDELTPGTALLLTEVRPRAVLYLTTAPGTSADPRWSPLRVAEVPEPASSPLAPLYVPVNDLASRQRHHGFGFVGYILVLPAPGGHGAQPPATAAWLTAALHDADVVVVEDAVASVWKGRALRGRVSVDTRMDLWRLLAHASVCVDLAPGALVGRECVEALQFGTPILVPAGPGAASAHASRGGGATFDDPWELVTAADALRGPSAHDAASASGRRYAQAAHGDSGAFVARVGSLLGAG